MRFSAALVFLTATTAAFAVPTAPVSGSRQKMLESLQSSCEKNAENRKIAKPACACVVRNHATHLKDDELQLVLDVYSNKPLKTSSAASLVYNFDHEVADECVKNPGYALKKRE